MVYLLDEGSEFEASVDNVWKYLRGESHSHPSMNLISRDVAGNTVTITADRTIMGKPTRVRIKNTLYPPFGMVQEHLEGPTAGSRAFLYYIPKGNKTGVTVVGDFTIAGLDEKATRDAVMAQLQVAFDEDNSNLKKFE